MKIYSVVSGIIKENDKYLVLRHNKCKGICVFPCGKVENGELPSEAIKRELFEEVGIEVNKIKFLGSYNKCYNRVDGIMHVKEDLFFIDNYNGTPFNKEPDKHLEMKWITKEDVLSNPLDYSTLVYEYMRGV